MKYFRYLLAGAFILAFLIFVSFSGISIFQYLSSVSYSNLEGGISKTFYAYFYFVLIWACAFFSENLVSAKKKEKALEKFDVFFFYFNGIGIAFVAAWFFHDKGKEAVLFIFLTMSLAILFGIRQGLKKDIQNND